jgi:hypothetical protein
LGEEEAAPTTSISCPNLVRTLSLTPALSP